MPLDALLSPLLESPDLARQVEKLQQVLAAERARREQFYEEITEDDKWEFINGDVFMHSPVSLARILVNERIHGLLKRYVQVHELGVVCLEKAMVCFTRNDYDPDTVFFSGAVAEGLQPTQWKFPVPQMIVEVISPSTVHHDRGTKFKDYSAHGVEEYWIVDPVAQTIEQYLLDDGEYPPVVPRRTGVLQSRAVSGFTMPVRAAFEDDLNLQELRKILGNPRDVTF